MTDLSRLNSTPRSATSTRSSKARATLTSTTASISSSSNARPNTAQPAEPVQRLAVSFAFSLPSLTPTRSRPLYPSFTTPRLPRFPFLSLTQDACLSTHLFSFPASSSAPTLNSYDRIILFILCHQNGRGLLGDDGFRLSSSSRLRRPLRPFHPRCASRRSKKSCNLPSYSVTIALSPFLFLISGVSSSSLDFAVGAVTSALASGEPKPKCNRQSCISTSPPLSPREWRDERSYRRVCGGGTAPAEVVTA